MNNADAPHTPAPAAEETPPQPDPDERPRSIVLVGLMGAGKSTVGARVAAALGRPFVDSDDEIEAAANMSISEIFDAYGETEFRALERRVMTRLLGGGPMVIATGGGAFVDADTRALVKARAISVWLKADIDVLMRRVGRRGGRPLLDVDDPRAVMARLIDQRHPIYAEADLTIESEDGPHDTAVKRILAALGEDPRFAPRPGARLS